MHAGNTLASNYHLIRNNPVDASKQIQIAATINRQAFMLVVDAKRPWKTIADLTAHLKERGEKGTYGTAANSGVIMCAIYKELAGLKSVEVNYKMAGDSLNDMASGNVDFGCHDPVFALSQVREGRLRILAVASADRLKAAPDYPSMTEAGYPMDLMGWFSAMVPIATPRPIVDQINKWFNQIHAHAGNGEIPHQVSAAIRGSARLTKGRRGSSRTSRTGLNMCGSPSFSRKAKYVVADCRLPRDAIHLENSIMKRKFASSVWRGCCCRPLRCCSPLGVAAQQYPSQDIHVICAFPAGSGADVLVRYFAMKLQEKAGKTVIVENKTGAAGNIAAEYTVRAKARRPHHSYSCRLVDRGELLAVQEAAVRSVEGIAGRGHAQPAAVHGRRRRETAPTRPSANWSTR